MVVVAPAAANQRIDSASTSRSTPATAADDDAAADKAASAATAAAAPATTEGNLQGTDQDQENINPAAAPLPASEGTGSAGRSVFYVLCTPITCIFLTWNFKGKTPVLQRLPPLPKVAYGITDTEGNYIGISHTYLSKALAALSSAARTNQSQINFWMHRCIFWKSTHHWSDHRSTVLVWNFFQLVNWKINIRKPWPDTKRTGWEKSKAWTKTFSSDKDFIRPSQSNQ